MSTHSQNLPDTQIISRRDLDLLTDSWGDQAAVESLTAEQQDRLTQILDNYLVALETGGRPDREAIQAANPDLAEHIGRYLSSLEFLQDAAGGFGGSLFPGESTPEERRLGDFRLIREIGRGGMGVVYEAWQVSLGRRVAVKVLPFASVLDSRQIQRFQNEAQAAAQLQHANIVPIFAVGCDRGVHFYAMQLIEGQPLDVIIRDLQEIDDRQTLPGRLAETQSVSRNAVGCPSLLSDLRSPASSFEQIARLGIQVAEGLHAAHEYGVIHRDVKPSNLLIDADGKVWIADFGLARCSTDLSLTRTGDVIGTARYMSPEQARGDSALVDQRTDVYSLGVTLYELATLRPVFAEHDGAALLCEIELGEPRRPRAVRPEIPVDLENIILRAIAPDRDERYPTALELAEDLQRFVDGHPTRATCPSLIDRAGKWARRHRRTVAWSFTLLLMLTIGSAVSTLLLYQETTRTDAALSQSEQNHQRSQENYRKAREIVDRLGARVAEQLADVRGAEEVRHALLKDMLTYYREFAEQSEDDSDLRRDVARAYSQVAALSQHVGSVSDALFAEEQAADLFRELIAEEPNVADHRANLAVCLNNQGLLLFRQGRAQEAEDLYRQALQLQSDLVRSSPDQVRSLRDLALSWNNLGLLLNQLQRIDQAEAAYSAALTVQRQLAARQPDDSVSLRHLAATTANRAAMLEDADPAGARQSYAEAISTMHRLVRLNPDSDELQCDLALAINNLGAFLASRRDFSAAVEQYRAAIAIQQGLIRRAPDSHVYRRDLAMSHNNLGLALSRSDQPQLAERAFREAASHQRALLNDDPQNLSYLGSLGGIYNNLALALEETEQHQAAAEAFKTALAQQEAALALAPADDQLREFLSRTCFNAGRVARRIGQPEAAVQLALRRRQLSGGNADRLLSVARELTLASRLLSDSSSAGQLTADECLKLAASSLQQAIDGGLTQLSAQDIEVFREFQTDSRFIALLTSQPEPHAADEAPAPLSSN